MPERQRGADVLVSCLEAAGVEYVFGVPGEETLDLVEALQHSPVRFITTRHEQGAAFMADVWGRLRGTPGVCAATLGPGATNLVTGVADAYLDRAPLLAIAGQGATDRLHKRSHQVLDLSTLFAPISKSAQRIDDVGALTETVASALALSRRHPPGPCFIELPEDIAAAECSSQPLTLPRQGLPRVAAEQVDAAADMLGASQRPLVLIGHGAVQAGAGPALTAFVECLNAPFTTTFMAKGAIGDDHPLALTTTGLSENEHASCGFDQADLVIAIGFDLVEYDPANWHLDPDKPILHMDTTAAEVDRHFVPQLSLVGDVADCLERLTAHLHERLERSGDDWGTPLRDAIAEHRDAFADDHDFPIKPQRLLAALRDELVPDDILLSDVGAHKVWIAHLWKTLRPNTCVISNGLAAMGIAVPGAIAAKLHAPERTVVAATGDAGFLMNAQEIETALRLELAFVVLVWNDSGYGLIDWHQQRRFGDSHDVAFGNPDLVAFAESFGARGFRVDSAAALQPVLREAIDCGTVAVIDCAVDYRENMRLTERLGKLTCRS